MRILTVAAVAQAKAAGVLRVYEFGSVPASPTYPYAVLAVTFADALGYTLDAHHGPQRHRIVCQSFGRSLASAQDVDDDLRATFLDQPLAIEGSGWESDPAEPEVASALVRDPDTSGVIGITSTFTVVVAPEE